MRRGRSRMRKSGPRTGLVRAMIVITALLLVLVLVDMQVRPAVRTMAAYQARLYAVEAINEAVAQELAEENVTYDSLVKLSVNQEGQVTAVETDMVNMNRLKVGITDEVVKELNELENENLKIPVGTLLGWQVVSGRGPMVDFQMMHVGYVQTELVNQFDSAGINQTRHQIMLHITIMITAVVPGYSAATEVTTNMCLAETIIIGAVPEAFTKVTGDRESTISEINDYGAKRNTTSKADQKAGENVN